MMKLKRLTLVLPLFLLSLSSKAELKVHFTRDNAQQQAIQKAAQDFWFLEEQYWKMVPVEKEIELDFSLVSADHLAQTRGHRINFNLYMDKKDLLSTLRHEIAHVFFSSQCPKISDPFTQELFAYWRSDDYLRILYRNKKSYTKSEALKELRMSTSFNETKTLALARLINEVVKKDSEEVFENWFFDLFRQCQSETFLANQNHLMEQFIAKIQGYRARKDNLNSWGFIVFDSLANEVIEAEGNWQLKQSPGSTLKPFANTFFSDLKKTKSKRSTNDWGCGDQTRTLWDFSSALNFSCNGFFLDTKYSAAEMENYAQTLNMILQSNYQASWLNMADAIGLWPTLKLNLRDLAGVYDYILEKDPATIEILKRTAHKGTLSGAPDSAWFLNNGIALKSGTTTGFDLSVENGFVVAVIDSGTTPKIAILYRSSYRPIDLLPELKSRILKYTKHTDSRARVQVLSRFNLESIQLHCPTLILKNGRLLKEEELNSKKIQHAGAKLSCIGSAFEVMTQDQVSRRLYGDLMLTLSSQAVAPVERARSEKNARARRGSQLILSTSEWHYLKNVFFSETQNRRKELQKAMLLVIKNNLAFWQHKNIPICDTTICQVFNLGYESVPELEKKSLNQLIVDVGGFSLGSPRWLEYSLGGKKPWQHAVKVADVFEFLKLEPARNLSGFKAKDQFVFSTDSDNVNRISCEGLRSFFRLKSCPDSFEVVESGVEGIFHGRGEGHERGMDLTEANQLAIQGFNFDQILENYYDLKVQKNQSK